MLKRMCQMASLLLLAGLIFTCPVAAAQSAQSFRQQSGLLAYAPPAWMLEGYFLAREKNPAYVFGPVREFVAALGGTPTWLIEDLELKRLPSEPVPRRTFGRSGAMVCRAGCSTL